MDEMQRTRHFFQRVFQEHSIQQGGKLIILLFPVEAINAMSLPLLIGNTCEKISSFAVEHPNPTRVGLLLLVLFQMQFV